VAEQRHGAWYERQGAPEEVLQIGSLERPEPGPGQVRVRVRMPLDRVADAHTAVEQGSIIGNVVLQNV
jgi:hypothetical protein